MKYVVYDVETTGLSAKDEIIQFAAIISDEQLKNCSIYNFYCMSQQPISPGAFNTHKMTREFIYAESKGKFFEDYWYDFLKNLDGEDQIIWVDWSKNGFDRKMINNTLEHYNLDPYFTFPVVNTLPNDKEYGHCSFNLMKAIRNKGVTGSLALENAIKLTGYSKQHLDQLYEKLTANISSKKGSMTFHDAVYDSLMTYLLLYHYVERM